VAKETGVHSHINV